MVNVYYVIIISMEDIYVHRRRVLYKVARGNDILVPSTTSFMFQM